MNLHPIDASIVIGYMVLIFGIGVWMERRAGKDIESYFLGGRSIPWWILGMSGGSSWFDITGTMWMVSVFYLLGMRGMWEYLMFGFPMAGFFLAYRAKWAYRSGVVTGMEWFIFRFGTGYAGQAARQMSVIAHLLLICVGLGYAGAGVGKFVEEFLPISKEVAVPLLFAFTGTYVMLGGFFSVVFSDFFQTVLLGAAAIYISVAAFVQIDPEAFRQTVGSGWFDISPVWELPDTPDKYADHPFGVFIILWLTRCMIILVTVSGGGHDFQRFRAARSESEATKIGLMWGMTMGMRFALVMSFTAFGLYILANHQGAVDAERVLPMVLNNIVPVGVKGLVIAGLVAAFMSTFDTSLNLASSFVVNDLVKAAWPNLRPKAYVYAGYVSTMVIVLIGILISMRVDDIWKIWNPMNFALTSILVVPALLTPYWERINGWAFCFSGAVTLLVGFYINVWTSWDEVIYFPILFGVSFATCLSGAYLFSGTPNEVLKNYYRKVRPWGMWGRTRRMVEADGQDTSLPPRDKLDIPVALGGTLFFTVFYLLIMDVVLHNWPRAAWLAGLTAAGGLFLYFAWWRRLPETDLPELGQGEG